MRLDQQTLRDLVDERLPRAQVRAIQSSHKDSDRFDKYISILQQKVTWDEQIVLPFGEHLFITKPSGGRPPDGSAEGSPPQDTYVVKCECGHEFCDYRANWKL